MTNPSNSPIKVGVNIKGLIERVGIHKPHHLWLAFGGSKSTAGALWHGAIVGIQFETMERLLTIIKMRDPGMYQSIAGHLNASGLFVIENKAAGGECADEVICSPS